MSDKWKQLIDLVVNEEEDKASELFHEIVIESSREIYGNLITSEEAIDEVNSDDVDEFINDIEADQEGVRTEDDDIEDDAEELESELDIEEPSDADHEEAEIEDRVVDLEDEIEALKATSEQKEERGEKRNMQSAAVLLPVQEHLLIRSDRGQTGFKGVK